MGSWQEEESLEKSMKHRILGNRSDSEKERSGGCFPRNLDKIGNGDKSN